MGTYICPRCGSNEFYFQSRQKLNTDGWSGYTVGTQKIALCKVCNADMDYSLDKAEKKAQQQEQRVKFYLGVGIVVIGLVLLGIAFSQIDSILRWIEGY